MVIQMLPHFHIPMPSGGDVEIPLHLIPLQTPINPTILKRLPPLPPRRLVKVSLPPPHLPQHMRHMRILLLLLDHLPAI